MAFGLNRVELIGRLGADPVVNHLRKGGRVANMSVATDESYINKQTGAKVERTQWHRIVTFQEGLIDMLEKHAATGRMVFLDGKLQTRQWRKPGEDSDRYATEILLIPGSRVQFLEKPRDAASDQAAQTGHNGGPPLDGAPPPADYDPDQIPF